MSETETNERYAEIVAALAKVEDSETQQHVIDLIEDGFQPLDLEQLR